MPALSRRAVLRFLVAAPIGLVACSAVQGQGGPDEEPPTAEPTATEEPATPTPTPPPPTPTPTPVPPSLELVPSQVLQGGTAMVVLNVPATTATATFQGRSYPMLSAGDRHWAMLGNGAFTKPGPYTVSVTYTPASGTPAGSLSLEIRDAKYPTESITLDPQTSTLLAPSSVNDDISRRAAVFAAYTPQKLWRGPFVRPSTAAIGDRFGIYRSYNGAPATDYHRGTDFTGQTGEPIKAAGAGKVAFLGPLQVRGNSVLIDHGGGVFTGYHHLSRFDTSQGAEITAGQQIGLIGATGLVTGPHLHWELIVRGVEVDGLDWLAGTEMGL